LINIKPAHERGCYIANPLRENFVMDLMELMEQYNPTHAFNEYLVKAAIEFWTAMTFPSLYLAKTL
jgi:hypothetical protein